MGYKHLREFGLTAKNPTHFQDFRPHRHTVRHRGSCCQTLWLSDQAALTKEIIGAQERDDGLFSLLGHYGDFDLAFFDVENCISCVALRKELVSLSVRGKSPALSSGRKKGCGIKSPRARFCRRALVVFNFCHAVWCHYSSGQSVQNCTPWKWLGQQPRQHPCDLRRMPATHAARRPNVTRVADNWFN